jgi:hypothetical protein
MHNMSRKTGKAENCMFFLESYLMDLALVLFQRFSKNGVSSSFIRINEPRAIDGLRLKEPNQPPVYCVLLLTPNEATSGFVRAVSHVYFVQIIIILCI